MREIIISTVEVASSKASHQRLPPERKSYTKRFVVDGHKGYITVSFYPDGRLGELYIRMAKEGSALCGFAHAFAQSVSVGLQWGVPLEVFIEKFKDVRFEPMGLTSDVDQQSAKSIIDYIFTWIERRFVANNASSESVEELERA